MSSGFVSSGTNDQPIERDDEWLRAQQELEEERRRKAEIGKQDDGKSLFEVLERNKSEPDSVAWPRLHERRKERTIHPGNLANMLG